MTTTVHAQRIQDLLNLAAEEGLTLPYPPEVIAKLEDSGAVVDLVTGAVIVGGADVRYRLTPAGEAWAIIVGTGFLDD